MASTEEKAVIRIYHEVIKTTTGNKVKKTLPKQGVRGNILPLILDSDVVKLGSCGKEEKSSFFVHRECLSLPDGRGAASP